jgi:hypothetical protein
LIFCYLDLLKINKISAFGDKKSGYLYVTDMTRPTEEVPIAVLLMPGSQMLNGISGSA